MSNYWFKILLLVCGDIESNPGPPRRGGNLPGSNAAPKPPTTEERVEKLESTMRGYEDKFRDLENTISLQSKEIENMKAANENKKDSSGMEDKLNEIDVKLQTMTTVYDDLNEKMYELDRSRQNNLLLYGIRPDFLPEVPQQLQQKVQDIIKNCLHISREIHILKVSRMISGPEVRGCRPVLVNFVQWRDRDEILRKANLLKGSNIFITEDLSRKVREHRHELQKFAKQIRNRSPDKKIFLRSDKLIVDNVMYVFDEGKGEVIRYQRPLSPFDRPNSRLNNYTNVDSHILRRATSTHSVCGGGGNVTPVPQIDNKISGFDLSNDQQQLVDLREDVNHEFEEEKIGVNHNLENNDENNNEKDEIKINDSK